MGALITARDLASAPKLYEILDDDLRSRRRAAAKVRPKATITYAHPDLDDDPEEDATAGYHLNAVKVIGAALAQEYPVHGKMVALEATGGVVMIELPPLITRPACGIVNLVKTPTYQWKRVAIRVFGEMLERLRLSREGFDQGDFIGAIQRRSLRDVRLGIVPQ